MVTSFKKSHAHTATLRAPNPAAGHCQPTPPPEAPGHSQASLGQSLVGSLPLSPGSWCSQRFVCALQESVSPVLWKLCNQVPLAFKVKFPGVSQSLCQITRLANLFWALEIFQQCENFFGITVLQFVGCLLGGSMVGLTHHTSQVCYSQNPCPLSRPLLTRVSAGDTLKLKGTSGSVSHGVPGSWCQ